ncbi:DUF4129 domain-containing protein [Halorussus salilacus]|uniref:DUF4129 domain-containing protein n=1 Tax=Halorussus salilacus TaxID=2953750 RepID=UPI00209CFF0C|nr:DUF4129 domain-containing protein [Halorussus salilacus]USZ68345.1 DUF4129 domain-containing protein [Halorussus salilacus]
MPVRDAAVELDGERLGETDGQGRIRVRLPESPGNATLAVERGPVSGETTVSLPDLTVSADPVLPVALPGTGVEVAAAYGDEPVPNASVRVGGGERRTGPNGSATATLPFGPSATVTVVADGQTRRTTVSGLFVNLLGVLVGTAAVVGGLALGARRRGLTPRRIAALLARAAAAIPRLAVALLFGIADRLDRGIRAVADAIRDLLAGEATVPELVERLRAWLRERLRAAQALAGRLAGEAEVRDADASAASDAPPHPEEVDSYRTLREAWADFLRVVSVRRPAAMTPGELADHAVREDDLPPEAVATLRDAFRDVEYGARSPAERLPRVEEALAAVEAAARPPESGEGSADERGETSVDEPDEAGSEAAASDPAGGDD